MQGWGEDVGFLWVSIDRGGCAGVFFIDRLHIGRYAWQVKNRCGARVV